MDLLPKMSTPEELAAWIKANHKEKFVDVQKVFYTEDEINEFARIS